MKKLLMMVAMAVCCMAANAQNEVGQLTLQPKVGFNVSTITGGVQMGKNDAGMKLGFVIGAEAEYGIAQKFSLAAGVLYSMQGCDFGEFKYLYTVGGQDYESGWDKNQYNFAYLNIPIVANYYLAQGFAIKAGIQPGFLLSAKNKVDGIGIQASDEVDMKSEMNSFDLSIPLGLSYETENVVIDARYNLGLTKLNKESGAGIVDSKNSVIQVTIGYKFAL